MLRSMLMLNTDDGMLLLSEMGYRQKVDLMKVLIETLNLPDDLMEKYRHLFADIEKTHQLRNTMVHAMAWVKGSRRNSIRPVRVRARGKIIVLGLGFRQPDKDIDYTPDDLLKKAEEMQIVFVAFEDFAKLHRDIFDGVKRHTTIDINSVILEFVGEEPEK